MGAQVRLKIIPLTPCHQISPQAMPRVMNILWACISSIAPVTVALLPSQDYTFDDFTAHFQKSYADAGERDLRRQIFDERLQTVRAHNADPSRTWSRGINDCSDLSDDEFRERRLGLHRGSFRQRPNSFLAPMLKSSDQNSSYPTALDWREKGVVSSVKNQGGCGSCWAFATAETIESHAAISSGILPVLSPQQLVDCAKNPYSCGGTGGCQGSIPQAAFNYVQLYGITTESMMPYTSFNGKTGTCKWNYSTTVSRVSIGGYMTVPSNDYLAVMDALVTLGPLVISVDASSWRDYHGGVFNGCTNRSNIEIDHAVQLVGYGVDDSAGEYWLVRNSWGVTFGEAGYIRLQRNPNPTEDDCGEDINPSVGNGCVGGPSKQRVCGTCGILFDVSYPLGANVLKPGAMV